ncbi:MAG: YbaK/EbsC family protein [Syntrophobacteraceae bacterium]
MRRTDRLFQKADGTFLCHRPIVETMAYEEIVSFLRQKGVSFKIHEHEPVITIEDAEKKAPTLIDGLLKTVAFRIKDSFGVLAAVKCRDRIDYRRLAAALGVNRRELRSLSPEEVLRDLGYEVGAVGPIPLRNDVLTVFDEGLRSAKIVYFGSGKNTLTLEVEFDKLLTATGGKLCRIVHDPPPGRAF